MHSLGIPFLVKNMQMSYVFYSKGQTATLNKPCIILIMQEGEKNVLSPLKQSIQPSLKFFLTVG